MSRVAHAAWCAIVLLVLCRIALADDAVPPPARLPAEVIVSGRTSTVKEVKTLRVGDIVPRTYSGRRLHNTPGFVWYVSEHYALKTDYKEDRAHFYLRLLELAYPHYVELFGSEPPGIHEKRMAVVYASTKEKLNEALLSDGIAWNFGGGGITFEGYCCAYAYPSGTLQYHQRYILLHECTHLFQMCLAGTLGTTPGWYYEGIADSFGSHVYDAKKQQLTVNVFDKATTADFLDIGLAELRKKPMTLQEVHDKGGAGRGVNFLTAHFFSDDPDRLQRFRIWRDEMFRLRPSGKAVTETSARLLQELFGPWDRLNADFRKWADSLRNTFHYAEWGWEQEGNVLWSYGFAEGGRLSQTDVFLIPNQRPTYDPFRMDYPAEEMPPLVGPVERGVAEPAVGALVSFARCPGRGVAGLGLGLAPDEKNKCNCLKLLIVQGKELLMEGTDLGAEKKAVPFPDAFREAAKAGGHRFGLTATIAKAALEVTLRAGADPGKLAEFKASLPVNEAQRERLLSKPLTILSRDGWHEVTPFGDDRRRLEPDLSVPAPRSRWRSPGDHLLAAVYKAAWRLGKHAPPPLIALRDRMLAAATLDAEKQRAAVAAFESGIKAVIGGVRACGAPAEAKQVAIADLLGLSLSLELASDAAPGHARLTAYLHAPLLGQATGNLGFTVEPADALTTRPAPDQVVIEAGENLVSRRVYRLAPSHQPFTAKASAWLIWRGEEVVLQAARGGRPSIPGWWVIGPFDNPGGDTTDIANPPEKEPSDLAKKYTGKGGKPVAWRKVERDPSLDVGAEHLVNFIQLYGPTENAAAYALCWLDAPEVMEAVLALGSDDGVVVWLNGERVHTNLVPRPYGSRADRVPLRLRKGRNPLLLKITQGMGDWSFAAHLDDAAGEPLKTITVSLEESKR
ncbi:MAG TPA: hypothetical protein VNE39_20215 [Planctomycetota bacterium]|nr:hypothetical protein [Planctomycetota bacterium]